MILHTLNASPASPAFRDCLRVVASGDGLLLLGDGVYAALPGTDACSALKACAAEIYILSADARAAGLGELVGTGTNVDMNEFVALSERFPRQQAWY